MVGKALWVRAMVAKQTSYTMAVLDSAASDASNAFLCFSCPDKQLIKTNMWYNYTPCRQYYTLLSW